MAALDFSQLQNVMKDAGFYDFILPWLLAFSIVFGILQTVNVFKKGDKPNTSVDATISMVVAFYLTIFTPYSGFLSDFFGKLFGSSIIVLSGVLVLLMFVGIFGLNLKTDLLAGNMKYAVVGIGIVLAAGLFFNANAGIFSFGDINLVGGEILTVVIFLAIIGFVMWYVVSGKPEETTTRRATPATS